MNSLVRKFSGLNSNYADATELSPGSAADGSKNVFYTRGLIKTAYGFEKVTANGLPLTGAVLGLFRFSELDKTDHFIAATPTKVYQKNDQTDSWTDLTNTALLAHIDYPMSFASVLHTDAIKLNGSGDNWYHHGVLCAGPSTPLQRWAGKYETKFYDLSGAASYHTTGSTITKHYAHQVGTFYNRLLLISPRISDAYDTLKENPQVILYPQIGKLETGWDIISTGAGELKLFDTGGYNVRGALLGNQWIQYQNNSVWSINWVGGTTVFEPYIEMPNLGLLAPGLLCSKNNVHYFVGNDYNVYAYSGGSTIELIGNNIQEYLEQDLSFGYMRRSLMTVDKANSMLCILIVPDGSEYVRTAYYIDRKTKSWTKRDFAHKWTSTKTGITSVSLIGASSYTIGKTYAEMIAEAKTYADLITDGTTYEKLVSTISTEEQVVIGDTQGNVYQFDENLTEDDDTDIPATHITEVWDWDVPGWNKLWPGIEITAKGTSVTVYYRTGNFDTEDTGWISLGTLTLTSEFVTQNVTIHDTSKKIQFKFYSIDDFEISNYRVETPTVTREV